MSRRQGSPQDLDFSDWEPRDCSTIPGLSCLLSRRIMGRFQVHGATVPQEGHTLTGVLEMGVGDSEGQEP